MELERKIVKLGLVQTQLAAQVLYVAQYLMRNREQAALDAAVEAAQHYVLTEIRRKAK